MREETFAQQKKLGVIPQDCQLTARPKDVPSWERCPRLSSRCCAGRWRSTRASWNITDYHVGRLLDGLEKLGILDDTLVYYIIGDNGASAEGSINGCYNEMAYFNGLQSLETPEYLNSKLDKLGGPDSYNHYARWAGRTP